jgi:hypothetical protein
MLNSKKILAITALTLSLSACNKQTEINPVTPTANKLAVNATSTTAVDLISNVVVASGAANQIATLSKGTVYYTDRTYTITSVPDSLANLAMIKTTNADKWSTSASYLTFSLSQAATVYIALDPRAKGLPAWLKSWQKLSAVVGLNDSKVGHYSLYSKAYAAGTVVLGAANASGASGIENQYFVLAKAKTGVTPPSTPDDSTPIDNTSFMLGVNGHSLGVPAYTSVSPEDQIALLKKMGMTCYRQNINFNADGTIPNSKVFNALYTAAKANGITILPMINSTTLNLAASESASYAAGNILGSKLAAKNAAYFKYYELANELDLKAIKSGNGDKATDYDANKLKIIAAYLKGLDDGIKASQPTAKTMIDASWLHYYFLQYMEAYGNKFDIVAWHWYSDMETTATRIKIPDISVKVGSLFGNKPIWFTEVGQRPDKVSNIDQVQSDFLFAFAKKMKQNPRVKAVLVYELFNEPQRGSVEQNYGLIKWTIPYTQYTLKTVAQTFSNNRL